MKPPRRRSLTLAAPQKNTPCSFHFARAGLVVSLSNPFFLLKGKENFFAGFCSQRARRRGWPLFFARTRRNSPPTPLPPFPCGDGRDSWRRYFATYIATPSYHEQTSNSEEKNNTKTKIAERTKRMLTKTNQPSHSPLSFGFKSTSSLCFCFLYLS